MAPDAKGVDPSPSQMERPCHPHWRRLQTSGGRWRGWGGRQHRLRSRREQGGSLSSGDVGRQVVLGGWPLVGREGTGVLGCHCFQGA